MWHKVVGMLNGSSRFSSVSRWMVGQKKPTGFIFSQHYVPHHKTYQYSATGRHREFLRDRWDDLFRAEQRFNKTPNNYEALAYYERARARWEEAKYAMAQLAHQPSWPSRLLQWGSRAVNTLYNGVAYLPRQLSALVYRLPLVGTWLKPQTSLATDKLGQMNKLLKWA